MWILLIAVIVILVGFTQEPHKPRKSMKTPGSMRARTNLSPKLSKFNDVLEKLKLKESER